MLLFAGFRRGRTRRSLRINLWNLTNGTQKPKLYILISTSTPAGRFKFERASMVLGVGVEISINLL